MLSRLLVLALIAWYPCLGAMNAECAGCHKSIFESYSRTAMANSSGTTSQSPATESFQNAEFTNRTSGFRYRVSRNPTELFFEFLNSKGVAGRKALPFFIGSGAAARSYLIADDGYLFQAPVTYYKAGAKWELAPSYGQYAYPYVTRPAAGSCMTCHASSLKPIPGTQNRYEPTPFLQGGISCERCHGSGDTHIANMKSGRGEIAIINPASLPPDRRDSICAQCHLSGEVRVMKAGATWDTYRPGDRLSDSVTVLSRQGGARNTVTSHGEDLEQSACKRQSGGRLWCASCHDPHKEPTVQESPAWFRAKCLNCHQTSTCKASAAARTARRDNCIACHMPKASVTDAQHIVFTNHSIPRFAGSAPVIPKGILRAIAGPPAIPRDLALGLATIATREGTNYDVTLLEQAVSTTPNDVEALVTLAEHYRLAGQDNQATHFYRQVLALDPKQLTAHVGLASVLFQQGNYDESIQLWKAALEMNQGLELVRTNLSLALWRKGDVAGAEANLKKGLEISPAFQPAADLLRSIQVTQISR